MAIVTYNDNGTIKVVKFGNYVVSTDADPVEEFEFYKVSEAIYNQSNFKFVVTVPQAANKFEVMEAFKTQQSQIYDAGLSLAYAENIAVKADEGIGNTYWKLRAIMVEEFFEFYEITSGEYNSIEYRLDVTIPELGGALDVMHAFKTQRSEYYNSVNPDNYQDFGVRADDGSGNNYWTLRKK